MTADEAYKAARDAIVEAYHEAKAWKRTDGHPSLNTFADGVEEGLSKALLIMNKHRVPEKTGDNE